MTKKISLGQFFTNKDIWLQPQVIDFIKKTNIKKILDPFAGAGDIFKALKKLNFNDFKGLDIDDSLKWEINDSLKDIPKTKRLLITNPPYLAKNSAKRKKLSVYEYFSTNTYVDLYQIGLEKCLQSHDYVVAIIPETFILTNLFTERLHSITVLEDNPFEETDFPVCVVCFTPHKVSETLVYKNDKFISTLKHLKNIQKKPHKNYKIIFNDTNGNIGLRGVDGVSNNNDIKFCLPEDLNYSKEKIKHSSRSITLIKIHLTDDETKKVIEEANNILNHYRKETADLLLAAFKGNKKNNQRRRRLDFKTARAILEEALSNLGIQTIDEKKEEKPVQLKFDI